MSTSKRSLAVEGLAFPERPGVDYERPFVRLQCMGGRRPCPFVSCKYNLYLDVNENSGTIKLNFPDLEVWEMNETCALDVADRGGTTLENVGAIMNLTRERVRQAEVAALSKIESHRGAAKLREYAGARSAVGRRLPMVGGSP